MKKAILLISCMLLLTGCWDRTELKKLGMVMGVAIDKDPDSGEYIFTSQLLRPSALSVESSGTAPPVEKIVTTGKTIFEALRKGNQEFDRKGFYAHNKIILVSDKVAKEGMLPVLDAFQHGKEVRDYVYLCITKNREARQILGTKSGGLEPIPAVRLKNMLENTNFQFNTVKINLLRFYKEVLGSGINPVVGVLSFKEDHFSKEQVKLSGGAAFYKDKLVGFLNEKETRGFRWVKGDIQSGALSLPSPVDEGRFDTVEVTKTKTKIQPTIKGDNILFTINVTGQGTIVEEESSTPLENNDKRLDHMKKIGDKMSQMIEREIKIAVEKAQNKLQSDIFGFGRALNIEDSQTWNKVEKDWNERFPKVPYTVNVHFSIKSTGLSRGPFQPAD